MKKIGIFNLSALTLLLIDVISSQTVPSSCFWCISQSKTWDAVNKVCDKVYSSTLVTTAQGCADLVKFDGIDSMYYKSFDAQNRWDSKNPIAGNFTLPINGIEEQRDVSVGIVNKIVGLDLQIRIQCDDSQVKLFRILVDDLSSIYNASSKAYSDISCGDRVRVQTN